MSTLFDERPCCTWTSSWLGQCSESRSEVLQLTQSLDSACLGMAWGWPHATPDRGWPRFKEADTWQTWLGMFPDALQWAVLCVNMVRHGWAAETQVHPLQPSRA